MENITNIENIESIKANIIENSQEVAKEIITNFLNKLKPFLIILLILIVAYLLYKTIRFFFSWKQKKRDKLTYYNTEKILEKLEEIERKLESLIRAKERKGKALEKVKKTRKLK